MDAAHTNEHPRSIKDVPSEVTHTVLRFHAIARSLLFDRLTGAQPPCVFPNCHALCRAYAKVFTELEVIDGVVILCNEGGVFPGHHSWLRFKRYPDFGIDVAPCGAIPYMTFPNLVYFDRFAPFHQYQLAPEIIRRAESTSEEFAQMIAVLDEKHNM